MRVIVFNCWLNELDNTAGGKGTQGRFIVPSGEEIVFTHFKHLLLWLGKLSTRRVGRWFLNVNWLVGSRMFPHGDSKVSHLFIATMLSTCTLKCSFNYLFCTMHTANNTSHWVVCSPSTPLQDTLLLSSRFLSLILKIHKYLIPIL